MPTTPSVFLSIIAISSGASLGALLRWLFGLKFNALLPALPLGTLVANLVGGYLIGVSLALFNTCANLAPEWRLFIITGFLGGLTTFSTFSAEVTSHLHDGRFGWAFVVIAVHVLGSVAMTLFGFATVAALQNS